jgi:hypothetical protein
MTDAGSCRSAALANVTHSARICECAINPASFEFVKRALLHGDIARRAWADAVSGKKVVIIVVARKSYRRAGRVERKR